MLLRTFFGFGYSLKCDKIVTLLLPAYLVDKMIHHCCLHCDYHFQHQCMYYIGTAKFLSCVQFIMPQSHCAESVPERG